ncbi:MAG: hypothetical protein E6J75_15300 [Deltaproteobacteria bacterium]|nr:MAG: hypothetical protein E6J75_15300 [Deltaproteobacteria bacterium]
MARAEAIHAECATSFGRISGRAPEHRLTRSVRDYLAKTPRRLAAEREHTAAAEYSREATRAEALDATVCKPFYHALYLGEVYRLAGMVGEPVLADALEAHLGELTARLERESSLVVLPLRPLVAVQAGAGLLALAAAD